MHMRRNLTAGLRRLVVAIVAIAMALGVIAPQPSDAVPAKKAGVATSAAAPAKKAGVVTSAAVPAKKAGVDTKKAPKAPKGCRAKGQRTIVGQVDTDISFGLPYRPELAAQAWYCATASRKHPTTITLRYVSVRGANAASARAIVDVHQLGVSYASRKKSMVHRKATAPDGKWLRVGGTRGLRLTGCSYKRPCVLTVAWYAHLSGGSLLGMWAARYVRAGRKM